MNSDVKQRIEQINRGEVPEGYKKTAVGIVPQEWEYKKLKEFCEICGGGTPDTKNANYWTGDIPWISSSDLKDNNINHIHITRFINKKAVICSSTKICPKGSILIVSRVGVGKLAIAPCEICTSQDFTNIIKCICNPKYLTYQLKISIDKSIKLLQGTSIKGISTKEIKNYNIIFPTNQNEQQRIADILSKWDEAIELQEKLIEKLELQKKALMQRLLTPKENWKKVRIGSLTKEISVRNKNNNCKNIKSVSNKYGFVNQNIQFSKQVASQDTSNYKIVNFGNIAYNPSRINVGSIAIYNEKIAGIVSPMYVVFECININPNLLLLLLGTDKIQYDIKSYLTGSVRDSLNYSDLEKIEIFLPDNQTQNKIIDFFNIIDQLIAREYKKLEKLTNQQKAMQQLLLTGIVRV